MEYDKEKKELKINRKLSELDNLVINFIKILRKYTDYVIISGYVSILLGRARATEAVDLFIKKLDFEAFSELYQELKENGFECLNSENENEIYDYLNENIAVRFSRKGKPIPNFEVKFPKREIDRESFSDFINVILIGERIKISSFERHIAFKRYYLKSDKDIEDALHVEELFKGKIDYNKINKLKELIENIED